MDAVVGTLQSPGAIYAASKLSYFDRMKNESKIFIWLPFVLSAGTNPHVSNFFLLHFSLLNTTPPSASFLFSLAIPWSSLLLRTHTEAPHHFSV